MRCYHDPHFSITDLTRILLHSFALLSSYTQHCLCWETLLLPLTVKDSAFLAFVITSSNLSLGLYDPKSVCLIGALVHALIVWEAAEKKSDVFSFHGGR